MPFICPPLPCQLHATCVCVDGAGLLIAGQSGSGKSALALQLMSLGASLVADDRCDLADSPEGIIVSRPDTLPEAIEARGLGILSARCAGPTRLSAVLDLDEVTTDRLPARSTVWIEQHKLPLLANSAASHLPAALLLFLKNGFHGSMLP